MTAKKKDPPKSPAALPKGCSKSSPDVHNGEPTNYREIQANELAALQSIYMADFEEVTLPAAAWSVCLR